MTTARRNQVALAAAAALIAIVCLTPSGRWQEPHVDLCVVCGLNGAASALLNAVLYLPLGVALWWRYRSMWRVVVIGTLCSLGVEVVQLVIPGRHTALGDLVFNSLGAALGGLLAIRPRAWLTPEGGGARVATSAVVMAACAMSVLAGLLFRPAAPPGDYYGQWTSQSRYNPDYSGRVLDAHLDTTPLPSQQLDDSDRIRRLLDARAPVRLRFIVGTAPTMLTPVFRLVAGPYNEGVEALQVGIDGDALVLTPRFLADDYRLSRPEVQLGGALRPFLPGDTFALELQARPDHGYDVRIGDEAPRLVGFTVGRSWSLLYATFLRSELVLRLMDHAWVFVLAVALGWCALDGRDRAIGLAVVVLVAAGTPLWSDLLPTPLTIYGVLAAGVPVGVLARRAVATPQRRDGVQSS